jgi:transposase InsO family protein
VAEQPGQTLNVDLCFVPVEHAAQEKLLAVSGSSGRLVVEHPKSSTGSPSYPGAIFTDPTLGYEAAMQAYVEATRDRVKYAKQDREVVQGRKAEKEALRRESDRLAEERYTVRERRKQEDLAWQAYRQDCKAQREAVRVLPKAERHQQRFLEEVRQQQWQSRLAHRRKSLAQREQEDIAWRAQRQQLRQRNPGKRSVQTWLAILVVADNCTRQCLGLPLFVAGPKVTAEVVCQALEVLLPAELRYLISDQGTHFRNAVLAKLAEQHAFIWVPIARHRAQSNGIAERFIRTLKEWLADKTWQSSQELEAWLAAFQLYFNHRPHQGLPIPGLSPNEFANRIWLM